ncbi:MAG: CapA family protein [Chitinophagales bacterium]
MNVFKHFTVFVLLVFACLTVFAQEEGAESIIHFKQRLLKNKMVDDGPQQNVDSNRVLHLMIAGNVYQTERHVDYAYDNKTGKYNFRNELKYIQPILGLGDITIANLKTSFGGDVKNMYSSPDEFALALKYSGISAVMHANLHTANVDRTSMKRTRDMLYDFGMYHTGAFADNFQRTGNYPLIINKKGFRIAILNYGNIGKRPSISRDFVINEIDRNAIERDMRMARANKPDFTIVYIDWGANNQSIPSYDQMELAQFCFQQGANMVVGTHPNTPMRLDYMSYNSNGTQKEGIVAYSLGNLIGSNEEIKNRNGYVIDLEIKKNNFTGDVNLGDWGVIPVYTYYDTNSVSGKISVYSLACSAVENGDILPNLPYIEKRRVINGAYEVRKLLGSTADEIQYNMTEMACNNVMETIDLTNAALNNKYNQTRKENIAPTDAPTLPVATSGSNNPPSLAVIYDDVKPNEKSNTLTIKTTTASGSNTAYNKEKDKAEQTFVSTEKSSGNNGVNSGTTNNTVTTNANTVGANKNSAPTNSVPVAGSNTNAIKSAEGTVTTNKQADNPITTTKQAESPSTTANNPVTIANKTVENNATTKEVTQSKEVANTVAENKAPLPGVVNSENNSGATPKANTATEPTTENKSAKAVTPVTEEPSKNKAVNTIAEEEANNKKKTLTAAEEEEERKRKAQQIAAEEEKKNKAANTNYHTEGNKYELADQTYAGQPKKAKAIDPNEKQGGPDAITSSKGTTTIANTNKLELGEEIKKLEEKGMHLVTDTFYRIQFYALKKYIPLDTNYYTHLKGYEVYEEDSLYKYLLGRYKDYSDCENYWKAQILPRYKSSFIVKYIDGKRVLDK